jgi:Cu-Zn family superoxide dismutase
MYLLLFSIVVIAAIFYMRILKMNDNKPIYAIAVFSEDIKGTVTFTEEGPKVRIDVDVSGLTPTHSHGFHVHQAGDLSEKCTSACAHFNPYNKTHGCPGVKERHVGDLGNILTDKNGKSKMTFYDDMIKLRGSKCNIIGRGLVIHQDTDDCGKGGNAESLKTGNAGKRLACAIIGYSKKNFQC